MREHTYYRCADNEPGNDHPRVRWRAADLEQAIVEDLASLRMPTPDIAAWFRTALDAALSDLTIHQRRQQSSLTQRRAELVNTQDRLLNAYLANKIDEATFTAKTDELKAQQATVDESLASVEDVDEACAENGPAAIRLEPTGGGSVARFKQCRPSRDLGCGLFEPHFERRKSRHPKVKAV